MDEHGMDARPPMNLGQLVCAAWAIGLGIWLFAFESTGGTSTADIVVGIVLIGGPVTLICLAVAVLRSGEGFAASVLALASLMAAGTLSGDMRGAPQAFAWMILLFGAPCVFVRAQVGDRRRKSETRDAD